MPDWQIIVPPLPMKEAHERLEQWKRSRAAAGEMIDPETIREDIIRSADGRTRLRYSIPSRPDSTS